jgi:hypothetical protein
LLSLDGVDDESLSTIRRGFDRGGGRERGRKSTARGGESTIIIADDHLDDDSSASTAIGEIDEISDR